MASTSTPYSIGIVGCGGMGRAHADVYAASDRAEVVAAADMSDDARAAFAAEYGVDETYGTHAEMVGAEDLDLDVVSICTWHSTHARIAVDAAEAGVEAIYCEKPMCTSLGEAEDMLDAAERNDVKLTVGHQRRFDPVHERARDLIQSGAIGDPVAVTTGMNSGLLNWGTHMIDITRYFLDDPGYEWVIGQVERTTDRHERKEPIEDRCVGHVCFEEDTRLTYESDMPDPDLGDATLHAQGTEGALALDLGSEVRVTNADGESTYAPEAEGSNRDRYVAALFDWLDGEAEGHRCGGQQALDVMELMMAIYESARTDGVVRAPLETRANPLRLMIENGDLPLETPGKYDIRIPYSSLDEA
jgi:predicted dehydrogenase